MTSLSSLSSPQSSLTRNWKHHVFPSFHGADVRRRFLSHVLKEFKSKLIDLFIDNDIERSKSIGPELVEAIRGSRIAIVVLSKNYASSTWCLDELVEIMRCREVLGQKVMTLFYDVDPTDVKKQTGVFGRVFRKTCKGKKEEDIERWKQALTEVAKIAGYHSENWDNEAKMIEDIAIDVLNKLNNSTQSMEFDGLIGMESHMRNMASLLQLDLKEARIIGIVGPSGIGKTTIARFLFNQLSDNYDFPLGVFMENIKINYPGPVCSDDYNVKKYFQGHFMSQLINVEGFKIPHLGVVKDKLKNKKVLVVLDDVDRVVQLEAMAKETSWFGSESRIIITTQDRKLLQARGINHTYNLDFPSNDEALQMFCMYAFGRKFPDYGFRELSREVTELAGNLPLGLRVMGSYFREKSNPEDWKKVLPRMKTSLDEEIESILKFSYDALHDKDKNLFLHIACFFNDESVDIVKGCLANSRLVDVTHGLDIFTEKSLISLEYGLIRMHNLLVLLGREIVQNQSINKLGNRQFFVDTRDIVEVFSDDKVDSSNVIGISIWISYDDKEDIAFTSEGAFERFQNLQFLRIGGEGVNLRSLNSISQKLRYLSWNKFPLPCFPSDFQPKFLVKLRMHYSQLEKLWERIQPLNNLKWIDLSWSECLKVLPDLSTAINLCELKLLSCSSLAKLPSIGNAIHLQKLYFTYCSSLVELPSIGNAIHLRELHLSYCSSLVKLHSSVGNAIYLQKLDFTRCSCLVELPSSIGNLINLKRLNFSHCSSLVELPSSIGKLINLKKLDFRHCSSLVKLPLSIGNLINLKRLDLLHCRRLVELPSSIGNLINLKKLDFRHCSSLVKLPFSVGNLINFKRLDLSYCSGLVELPSSMRNLVRLSELVLKKCSKLEVCLTNINLESLEELFLSDCSLLNIEGFKPSGTEIDEVPSLMTRSSSWPLLSKPELSFCETKELGPWIGRISYLRRLVLSGMQNLVSLPQLPYSIEELDAVNCESLERLDCSFRNPDIRLNFAKCFKLNQEARDLIIHTRTNKYAVLPGGEVPACFIYRASGSSLTVNVNQKSLRTSTKYKVCIILADERGYKFGNGYYSKKKFGNGEDVEVYCVIRSKENALSISSRKEIYSVLPDHLYTFEVEAMNVTSTELVFKFTVRISYNRTRKIKGCGIFQLDREAYGE